MYPALNASPWIKGRARWTMCIPHGSWKLSAQPITQSFAHFYFYSFFFFTFAQSSVPRLLPKCTTFPVPHSSVHQRADGTGAAYLPTGTSPHGPDPPAPSAALAPRFRPLPHAGCAAPGAAWLLRRSRPSRHHPRRESPLPADGQWSRTRGGSCRCRGCCTGARAAGTFAGDELLRVRRSF